MTWYFDPSGTTLDIYDHNGDKVRSNVSFSGSWSGDYPDAVLSEMREIWEQEANLGNSPVMSVYAAEVLMHMLDGPIEEGTP